ncbi:MAG: GlsB/YeaQ/YmgE family stress response membrane protein [Actinomycetota bacterium]|nr:GlsB/YeaQ/YmgE family stress response membrane protein [Actinomycetota bacterium]
MILTIFVVLVLLFVVLPLIGMALWAIVSTIVVGLIVGGLGRLVVPGAQPIGFLATVGAGLCGSILGGFFGQHVFHIGWFATLLLEIAIAAVVVAVMTGRLRRAGVGPSR